MRRNRRLSPPTARSSEARTCATTRPGSPRSHGTSAGHESPRRCELPWPSPRTRSGASQRDTTRSRDARRHGRSGRRSRSSPHGSARLLPFATCTACRMARSRPPSDCHAPRSKRCSSALVERCASACVRSWPTRSSSQSGCGTALPIRFPGLQARVGAPPRPSAVPGWSQRWRRLPSQRSLQPPQPR